MERVAEEKAEAIWVEDSLDDGRRVWETVMG
jgi:hypothetical protein